MTSAEYAAERGVTTSALSHERATGGGPPWFWWNAETRRRVLYNRADVDRWMRTKQKHGEPTGTPAKGRR